MQPVPSNAALVDYATRWPIAFAYRNPALAGILLKTLNRHPGSLLLLPTLMEDIAINLSIPPRTA